LPTTTPTADPVSNDKEPDEPELVVPVANDRTPLTPAVPALEDLITTEPEDLALDALALILMLPPVLAEVPLLSPPDKITDPPLPDVLWLPAPPENVRSPPAAAALVAPAVTVTDPPSPNAPAPIVIVRSPPAPPVLSPVAKVKDPDVPALVVPVENNIAPLVPEFPAFDVAIESVPLALSPKPEFNTTVPPAADADVDPPAKFMIPPLPVLP